MIMMYILFLLSLVVCRFFAGYDSRFQNGKYIIINDPKLRMLLVDEMSFFERTKRLKKDINKMTVSGLFFYIYSLVTLILSVLLHLVVSKTPIEPWEIETDDFFMYVDTLNEKLSAIVKKIFSFQALLIRVTKFKTPKRKSVLARGRIFVCIIHFSLFIIHYSSFIIH